MRVVRQATTMSKTPQQDRFVTLLDEHRKILYKVAGSYARTASDRQDLVQEMVVQLWRSFDRYDAAFRFSTWMYRIALNVAISFFRVESRKARTFLPAEDSILESAAAPAESDAIEDDLRILWQAIDGSTRWTGRSSSSTSTGRATRPSPRCSASRRRTWARRSTASRRGCAAVRGRRPQYVIRRGSTPNAGQ